jgi:hypothetical protein
MFDASPFGAVRKVIAQGDLKMAVGKTEKERAPVFAGAVSAVCAPEAVLESANNKAAASFEGSGIEVPPR